MRTAEEVTRHSMSMLMGGCVRNHKLANTSSNYGVEAMVRERQRYRDFLPTKMARLIYEIPEKEKL